MNTFSTPIDQIEIVQRPMGGPNYWISVANVWVAAFDNVNDAKIWVASKLPVMVTFVKSAVLDNSGCPYWTLEEK